jgi:adenylyl cyclase-associated protein
VDAPFDATMTRTHKQQQPERSDQLLGRRGPIPVHGSVLTTVIYRLEAATSRLEDIASSSVGFETGAPNGASTGPPALAAGGPSSSESITPKAVESLPPSIQAFDTLLNTELKTWLDLSSKLGNVIDGQVWKN